VIEINQAASCGFSVKNNQENRHKTGQHFALPLLVEKIALEPFATNLFEDTFPESQTSKLVIHFLL